MTSGLSLFSDKVFLPCQLTLLVAAEASPLTFPGGIIWNHIFVPKLS